MANENQRAGETPAPPTDAELARARAAYQEAASTVFASGHDGGRGWPPEPWLHPLVAFERAARERTLDELGVIRGAAADAFLADMEREENLPPEERAAKVAFLEDCERVYRESQEKNPASPEGRLKAANEEIGRLRARVAELEESLRNIEEAMSWRRALD